MQNINGEFKMLIHVENGCSIVCCLDLFLNVVKKISVLRPAVKVVEAVNVENIIIQDNISGKNILLMKVLMILMKRS